MSGWKLKETETLRIKLTKEQEKAIKDLYTKISQSISSELARLPSEGVSNSLRRAYLNRLQEQINEQLTNLGVSVKGIVTGNMGSVAKSAGLEASAWLRRVGFPIQGEFSHVPDNVVRSIITGQVYDGDWTLSKAIWSDIAKNQKDINTIIAEGVAQNKTTLEIAQDLEAYVNPSAAKKWDWSKVYPGTNTKVDYNAQRLARTLVSHAYQQAFVAVTKPNPFVTKYRWLASNSSRVCELCASRDGVLFDKDDLPMDHPNGMCTFVAEIPDTMVDIADRIADWAEGKEDPELDRFAKFLQNS